MWLCAYAHVCKREITRDEAKYYLANQRTELLTDFSSRFGRPFSATLVIKETGRHGFEFQPRASGASKKKASKKKASKKKTSKKSAAKKAPSDATPAKATESHKALGSE